MANCVAPGHMEAEFMVDFIETQIYTEQTKPYQNGGPRVAMNDTFHLLSKEAADWLGSMTLKPVSLKRATRRGHLGAVTKGMEGSTGGTSGKIPAATVIVRTDLQRTDPHLGSTRATWPPWGGTRVLDPDQGRGPGSLVRMSQAQGTMPAASG